MRGTFKGIEVKRRGGVQAHRGGKAKNSTKTSTKRTKLSDPPPLRFFYSLPRELSN